MTCNGCHTKQTRLGTAVVNGKFGMYCTNCIAGTTRQTASGFAQYSRARDREDNAKDLLQPWDKRGKPNREFINNYPEEAQNIFTEKELSDNG